MCVCLLFRKFPAPVSTNPNRSIFSHSGEKKFFRQNLLYFAEPNTIVRTKLSVWMCIKCHGYLGLLLNSQLSQKGIDLRPTSPHSVTKAAPFYHTSRMFGNYVVQLDHKYLTKVEEYTFSSKGYVGIENDRNFVFYKKN